MYIGAPAFAGIADRLQARELFRLSVSRVEIETHSYCNRRCAYCPNRDGHRLGENVHIDDGLFALVLENLAEIAFSGVMVLSSYDEPLADRAILKRLAQAKAALPGAELALYSNGDYLKPDYLEELAEAGLKSLTLSIHPKGAEAFSGGFVRIRMKQMEQRLGIPLKGTRMRPGQYVIAEAPHPKVRIEVRAVDHFALGTRRGNLVPEVKAPPEPRRAPCNFPFSHFTMGYTGNIVPCCHIVSDAPEHQSCVIGNLKTFGSIFQAFASGTAAAWRRHLITGEVKREPCRSCSVPFPALSGAGMAALRQAAEKFGRK